MSGTAGAIGQAALGVGLVAAGAVTGNPMLIAGGVGMVAGSLAGVLAPKPALGGAQGQGPQVGVSASVPGERIIYGEVAVPGVPFCVFDSTDQRDDAADREFAHVGYLITRGRPLNALTGVWLFGKFYEVMLNNGQVDYWPDHFYLLVGAGLKEQIGIYWNDGNNGSAGWTYLMGDRSDDKWTTAHKLTDCAYVGITYRYHPEKLPTIPQSSEILFQVQGFSVLNPANGNIEYSDNVALCWRDFITSKYGPRGGVPAGLVSTPHVDAAAAACEENIARKDGGSRDRYTLNGWWDATEDVETIEEGILAAMAGYRVKSGDTWLVWAGVPQATSMWLTDDDLAAPISQINPYRPYDSLSNEVHAVFLDRKKGYTDNETTPYVLQSARDADGGAILVHEVELRGVTDREDAARLAYLWLLQHRLQLTCRIGFKPKASILRAGEIIQYTDRTMGWNSKKFIIAGFEYDVENMIVWLDLGEYEVNVFHWNPALHYAEENDAGGTLARTFAETQPLMLDFPAVRYQDAIGEYRTGFYAAFKSKTASGKTAASRLYRAQSENGDYQPVAYIPKVAVTGRAQNVIHGAGQGLIDSKNQLEVLLDKKFDLKSRSLTSLANGFNMAALHPFTDTSKVEIFQFATAVYLGDRVWRLSNLRRGLFGTENRMTSHFINENFILLDEGVVRVPQSLGEVYENYWYKINHEWASIRDVQAYQFINRSNGARPIMPQNLRMIRNHRNDYRILWTPRQRGFFGWTQTTALPIEERIWRVRRYKSGKVLWQEYIRESTPEPEYTYVADDVFYDDKSYPSSFDIGVSQRTPGYGDGPELRKVIRVSGTFSDPVRRPEVVE
jgi:hypothetical protein